ncbi:type I polyketide synthase [Microcoleus sp. F4-D5]|uniref:type I polyketide synthase n=1 Tax=Microcoleus sp. F4-D5 TaxID=2818760 RepID=UPI002FCFD59F
MNDLEIAVIGMSCRLPGAKNIEEYWQNLLSGVESISRFSDDELLAEGVKPELFSNPDYVRAGGVLSEIDMFDASFFGFSPSEAKLMDPQQRMFLECAWEAIEKAGYNPEIYDGLIGVYAGVGINTYLLNNIYQNPDILKLVNLHQLVTANDKDYLPTRVSYKLNLKGPSINVQTACSTSLVAVHLACQSLLNGECDMALVGGVSARVPHKVGHLYEEGMILSPDGHCRAFDAEARGTVGGNGVGIVVLKRLSDAIADGDCVHATIKGSAINNDGSLKIGYTAPSIDGQAAVIAEAQAVAGVEPETITYIEAHGTGTNLGDPIEIAALSQAFREKTDRKNFCAIGSVKTNIGHTDAASGVASLIKTVLALKNKTIPPSLHFEKPNPKIDFANSPFYVNNRLSKWETNGFPRRAGVSSFGIGGTNAHIILEEALPTEASGESRPWQILVISAKTSDALEQRTKDIAAYFQQEPELNIADAAYTLSMGRQAFNHRRMLVCQQLDEAAIALNKLEPTQVFTSNIEPKERPVVYMFSGQGSQYVNMGRELYDSESIFREQVDRCAELLLPELGIDLRLVLYPSAEKTEVAARELKQTKIAQPALFVIEYALAQQWQAWGVQPEAAIGHSIGEYVAACIAGVFSLEDALSLVAARGEMMQQMPIGAMLSIFLPKEKVQTLLGTELSLATINSQSSCVVSGPVAAVEALEKQLASQDIQCRRLQTSHAFHSWMMDPMLDGFARRVKQVNLQPPKIPYISNLTGKWITVTQATDPNYWVRHLRETVLFEEGLQNLLPDPDRVLLEVGPGRTLSTLAKRHPDKSTAQLVLTSLRHPQEEQADLAFLLDTLGKLWLAGVKVDWSEFYSRERRHRLPLPTYPFERQRYWISPQKQSQEVGQPNRSGEEGKKQDISDWFYTPSWNRSQPGAAKQGKLPASVLVFIDEYGLGDQLAKQLQEQSREAIAVKIGESFTKLHEGLYAINPREIKDYERLFAELPAIPKTIVHLWSLAGDDRPPCDWEGIEEVLDRGFYSLLFLAQALGKQNLNDDFQLAVVSNNLQNVTGQERLRSEQATIIGPVKTIPQEYPTFNCRSIDLEIPQAGTEQYQETIDQLMTELKIPASDEVIAYRGQHRWVQTFTPIPLEDKPNEGIQRLTAGGVYLVTGGMGGIGLVLAEYLAQTVQAKLVLIGRSAFPERNEWSEWLATHDSAENVSCKIRKLQELEKFGAEVLPLRADVADFQQMQKAIGRAKQHFGKINGVIHAAGVPGGGLIQQKTREMAEKILAPKVRGTLILDALLKDTQLDFFVVTSSLNSLIPVLGQVDYCAANAFLDAFAQYKNSKGKFTVSINWDAWQEVGMAAATAEKSTGTKADYSQIAHPLFDSVMGVDESNKKIYISNMSISKNWILQEHLVMGQATIPGTAYLEIARAAFEHLTHSETVELREVFFLTPLTVKADEEKEVRTIITKNGNEWEFEIVSKLNSDSQQWQKHCVGEIVSLEVEKPTQLAIQKLEAKCLEHQQTPILVEKPQASLIEFGPRWDNVKWVKFGQNEGLAFLELNENFIADIKDYKLHPALLDTATGFMGLKNQDGAYLPFSYKKVKLTRPIPEKVYSYITQQPVDGKSSSLKMNVTIADEMGVVIVDIEEYTLRKIDGSK